MKKILPPSRNILPVIAVVLCIVFGVSVFTVFMKKDAKDASISASPDANTLRVIDNTGSDPRQQQATGMSLQGAAKVSDFMQDKGSSAVQQGQGIEQGPTSVDELLKDKTLQ
jgi:hypothetical protein